MRWDVPAEMSVEETKVAKRLHRVGRFYVFLREIRRELFEGGFEEELEAAYKKARGTEPLPPALLAMVTLLQAYDQVSDADAVITAQMDKRWQLVLGCLGAEEAPFSQGALVSFRDRMVLHDLDRKLLDRTVALAKAKGGFGWQKLKVALDSSPLLGAGRVEDTWNLIGRALSLVVDCAAKTVGVSRDEIIAQAKLDVLRGPSIKVALDIDWDDPTQQTQALQRLLEEVARAQAWVANHASDSVEKPPLKDALAALRRVIEQDLEPDPSTSGKSRIRRGVAPDRTPSMGDPDMRHGRKSKSKAFTGYKRHIAKAHGVIIAALVQPANRADNVATDPLLKDAARRGAVEELHIDRGFLGCDAVDSFHAGGGLVLCKPLAESEPRSLHQARLQDRPRETGGHLSSQHDGVDHEERCKFSRRSLRFLRAPIAMHGREEGRSLRRHSSAGKATPSTAPAPRHPRRTRPTPSACHRRALAGRHRRHPRPPRPLQGHPEELPRPSPLRCRRQPPSPQGCVIFSCSAL